MKKRGMTRFLQLNKLWIPMFSLALITGCEKESIDNLEGVNASAKKSGNTEHYEFSAPVYDIAAAPDGSILVGLNENLDPTYNQKGTLKVQQIKNGKISTMAEFQAYTALQGIAPIGAGNAFITTGGADLAEHGELYRLSNGNVRMVADLGAYEAANDPDAFFGNQWKNQLCEATGGFSAGPQNNPFKVAVMTGGEALVADAAGNTILSATTAGEIDWKAIFTPPLDENGEYMVGWSTEDNGQTIPCYVQPVPTSIAVGPDGYIYVGELTGAVAEEDGFPIGHSRVWKIPADATNVVCEEGTGACQVLISGLTSVLDVAIGPDELLYVVEFDKMSWFASFIPGLAAGGRISMWTLDGEFKGEVPVELSFPSAIAFDKEDNLWVLENNYIGLPGKVPTVRMLEY